MRIAVALTVLKPHQKRALGLGSEREREAVVEDLLQRLMGKAESEAIILEPSLTGDTHSPRRGVWGKDEPHPFPDMPFADH